MSFDPNDPNRPIPGEPKETYVEPVERRSSALPLIIGVLLALALAYFVLQRFMGDDAVTVEGDTTTVTTTEEAPVDPAATDPVVVTEPTVDTEAEQAAAEAEAAADNAAAEADAAAESAVEAEEAATPDAAPVVTPPVEPAPGAAADEAADDADDTLDDAITIEEEPAATTPAPATTPPAN